MNYLSTREVAARLGCTSLYVYQLVKPHQILFLRRGRSIIYPRVAFERFIERQAEEALSNLASSMTKVQ